MAKEKEPSPPPPRPRDRDPEFSEGEGRRGSKGGVPTTLSDTDRPPPKKK